MSLVGYTQQKHSPPMKNDPVSRSQPFDPVYTRLFALYETSPAEARRVAHALANHEARHLEARHLVHGEWSPEAQGNTKARIAQIHATLAEVALNAAYAAALRDAVRADSAVRDATSVRDAAADAASYAAAYASYYARTNADAALAAADAAYATAASVRDAAASVRDAAYAAAVARA